MEHWPAFKPPKCETQSGKKKNLLGQSAAEYFMHCINYAKREQEKPLLFKLTDYGHISHYHKLSLSCHKLYYIYIYILVVFGLSTLNSNLTNHKLQCKKIANKKCQHMSLQPWGIQTRYWALKYADALYRSRVRAFATQASLAKQNKRSSYQVKLKLW